MDISIKKIGKLRIKINKLRSKGGIRSAQLEALAKACGRVRHKRGKEPTWVNLSFRELRPLSIPHHTGNLNKNTAGSILDQLEGDLDFMESALEKQHRKEEDL